jgi:ribosomal protein L7/L12
VNNRIGIPHPGWSHAVAWIKQARDCIGCGLKEAKDLHDFVRDNPTVANA